MCGVALPIALTIHAVRPPHMMATTQQQMFAYRSSLLIVENEISALECWTSCLVPVHHTTSPAVN